MGTYNTEVDQSLEEVGMGMEGMGQCIPEDRSVRNRSFAHSHDQLK